MSLTAILVIVYAIVGIIAGAVMLVTLIANWGLAPGWTMITIYLFVAALWPIAVPMILAAIKDDKNEKEKINGR